MTRVHLVSYAHERIAFVPEDSIVPLHDARIPARPANRIRRSAPAHSESVSQTLRVEFAPSWCRCDPNSIRSHYTAVS